MSMGNCRCRCPSISGSTAPSTPTAPAPILWLLAGIGPLMALALQFVPRIDPKRDNYVKFQRYYDQFAIFLELFFLAVFGLSVAESLRPGTVSIGRMVTALVSVLLVLLGNMMGKIKHNYFFGIRTPWTLADPDVWVRTPLPGRKTVVCPGAGAAAWQFSPAGAGVFCDTHGRHIGVRGTADGPELSVVPGKTEIVRGEGLRALLFLRGEKILQLGVYFHKVKC